MKKKFSFAIILFIVGIIVAASISVRAVQEAYRGRKIEKMVDELKQQQQAIEKENDELQKNIDYLGTPEFVERVSKDKMNMQKPDENVVVVDNLDVRQPQTAENNGGISQTDQNIANYEKWWNFFFKYN